MIGASYDAPSPQLQPPFNSVFDQFRAGVGSRLRKDGRSFAAVSHGGNRARPDSSNLGRVVNEFAPVINGHGADFIASGAR